MNVHVDDLRLTLADGWTVVDATTVFGPHEGDMQVLSSGCWQAPDGQTVVTVRKHRVDITFDTVVASYLSTILLDIPSRDRSEFFSSDIEVSGAQRAHMIRWISTRMTGLLTGPKRTTCVFAEDGDLLYSLVAVQPSDANPLDIADIIDSVRV